MKKVCKKNHRGEPAPKANHHFPIYTDAETEFFDAMERFKLDKRRRFPTLAETLEVVIGLGYRKDHSGAAVASSNEGSPPCL